MTTEIHKSHNPRLPAPSDYPAHVDRILSEPKHEPNRLWTVAAIAASLVFIILWPRIGLTLCALGGLCLLWAIRRAGK